MPNFNPAPDPKRVQTNRGNQVNMSDVKTAPRRCDICDEPMFADQFTVFVTIDGIPGKRHTECYRGKIRSDRDS